MSKIASKKTEMAAEQTECVDEADFLRLQLAAANEENAAMRYQAAKTAHQAAKNELVQKYKIEKGDEVMTTREIRRAAPEKKEE